MPTSSDLRNEMLGDTLRERALHIREEREDMGHHLAAPNQVAEKETLRALDCGMLLSDEQIELTTDAGCFCEGDIAFCAEPWRLTLWGQCSGGHEHRDHGLRPENAHTIVFRYVDLPC